MGVLQVMCANVEKESSRSQITSISQGQSSRRNSNGNSNSKRFSLKYHNKCLTIGHFEPEKRAQKSSKMHFSKSESRSLGMLMRALLVPLGVRVHSVQPFGPCRGTSCGHLQFSCGDTNIGKTGMETRAWPTWVARGGQPLGSGRQLPPQLTVGRRPLGGGGALEGGFREGRLEGGGLGGAWGGGGLREGRLGGGGGGGRVGGGGGVQVGRFGAFWPLRSPKSLESGPRGDGVHVQADFILSRATNA